MSSNQIKKKKSILKISLISIGVIFALLLATIIIIPIFFKEELKNIAIKEANKMLKADVALGDFDLTLISSFPKMKLIFNDVSITGRGDFEGVKLIDLKTLEAKLDFWSVINMEDLRVRSIKFVKPDVHVILLKDGTANYDIVKTNEEMEAEGIDTTSSPFKLNINNYEIQDGNIIYDDKDAVSPMWVSIKKLNHRGKGDLTLEEVGFQTKSTIGELIYKASGSMYAELKNLDNVTEANISTGKIDFKTKSLADELSFKMDGLTYLTRVKTNLDLDLLMEYDDESTRFTLKNNILKLNDLNLSFNGGYNMYEKYDDIDLTLKADEISFKNLLSIVPTFYHTGYESMIANGKIAMAGFLKGRMDASSYPAWDFNATIKDASITYPDMPENIKNINVIAKTKFPGGSDLDKMTVDIDKFSAQFVGNNIDANFYLKNPMSDPYIKSHLDVNMDLATLEQVYPTESKYTGKLISDLAIEGKLSDIEKEQYQKFTAKGALKLNGFNYESEDLPAPLKIENLLFEFTPQHLKLADMKATLGKSDFSMSGEIKNYMEYLFKENEDLKGVFNLYSKKINIDEIMPSEGDSSSKGEPEVTPSQAGSYAVPKNIDFVLNSTFDEVIYDGLELKRTKGKVILKNQEVNLENLYTETMGGTVLLNGKYNTQNPDIPKVNFSYSLKNIDIEQLSSHFLTIDKLAPVAKYVKGNISSDFAMSTDLTTLLEPIYQSLNGKGSLFSSKVVIEGFEPLNKVAEALQIERIKKQTIENIRATFEFHDGKVRVKPFDVKLGNIVTSIAGTTSFDKDIDYELNMRIPKGDLPKEIVEIAEQAIAKAKKIPGFKMKELPNEIPVTAFITNKIDDPKVKTNMKEKLMELGGNIKGDIKDFADEKTKEVKDTIRTVVTDKVEEVKDKVSKEVEKRKQEVLDAAEKQANKIRAEGSSLANKTREEANANAQRLIDNAGSNPIKKKTAEIAAKKLKDEGEKAAKKIENEANDRADKVMQTARENADKIK